VIWGFQKGEREGLSREGIKLASEPTIYILGRRDYKRRELRESGKEGGKNPMTSIAVMMQAADGKETIRTMQKGRKFGRRTKSSKVAEIASRRGAPPKGGKKGQVLQSKGWWTWTTDRFSW